METRQVQKASPLRCVTCGGALPCDSQGDTTCGGCNRVYRRDKHGYLELLLSVPYTAGPGEDYVQAQRVAGDRVYSDYLRPLFEREPFETVLEVGCGIGRVIKLFAAAGSDAYGTDLPVLSECWAREGNDPRRFFCGDATNLPFPDNYFDIVFSFGVIEHIGTAIGHCTLSSNYQTKRALFASELMRVTKPGGRIFIGCPNKHFPVDIQHGPEDEAGRANWLRRFIFAHTGLNLHKTWGKYHLPSYGEIRKLFCVGGKTRRIDYLSLRGYLGFGKFSYGYLRPFASIAKAYIHNIPGPLRPTFLNPCIMVQIRN